MAQFLDINGVNYLISKIPDAKLAATWTKATKAEDIAAGDTIAVALGKLQKTVDGKANSSTLSGYVTGATFDGAAVTKSGTVLTINHPTDKTAKTTSALYKFTVSNTGHVDAGNEATAADLKLPTGYAVATTAAAPAAGDTISVAIGKLQKEIAGVHGSGHNKDMGAWKFSVDAAGHVTTGDALDAGDIMYSSSGTVASRIEELESAIGDVADGLGTAAAKNVCTSAIAAASTDTNLPTAAQVAEFVENKGYVTGATAGGTAVTKTNGVLAFGAAAAKAVDTSIADSNKTSTNLPTTKAVYDYISTTLASYFNFKGAVPSTGLPTKDVKVGDAYRVATAGTYAGQTCEVGDIIIATATTPTWTVVQNNIDLASANYTGVAPITVDNTTRQISHDNSLSAAVTSGLYKFSANIKGHVTGVTAVAKADITALGIPAQDTTYTADNGITIGANNVIKHTNTGKSKTSGLYKITVDAQGHVSAATAVAAADLPAHTHTVSQITDLQTISNTEIDSMFAGTWTAA